MVIGFVIFLGAEIGWWLTVDVASGAWVLLLVVGLLIALLIASWRAGLRRS